MIPANKIKKITQPTNEFGSFAAEAGKYGIARIEARVENFGNNGMLFYDVYHVDGFLECTLNGNHVDYVEYFPPGEDL
jgi:hypothetical protein